MSTQHELVFFFDIDNTLLDNDRVTSDLRQHLSKEFGQKSCEFYFELFEELRNELGYADYLGTLQRYRMHHMYSLKLLRMSSFLVDYPFSERLFPRALEVIAHCRQWGRTAVLSDGDVVFQPRKVERAGIWKAVDGHVLIYIHKEQELEEVERLYPAQHYVLIDDKLRILTAVKRAWGNRVTTVFPRQGHYALDPQVTAQYPPADVTIDALEELLDHNLDTLWSAARGRQSAP